MLEKEHMNILERKASVLIDALPYIRDFNQKIVVIVYDCVEELSGVAERELMQDIVILKSVGMKPVVVHGCRMGMDKFRENKRIAKLIELSGVKAIGICGVDYQTLDMMVANGYIPVVVPNDIDNENEDINQRDTAVEIAVNMGADKLIFLSGERGIPVRPHEDAVEGAGDGDPFYGAGEDAEDAAESAQVYSFLTLEQLGEMPVESYSPYMQDCIRCGTEAVKKGVHRVHVIDGGVKNALLLELFSKSGIGTVIMEDTAGWYDHEKD